MYKLVIIALLVNLGLCQEFIKESNMWQLDKDSFWKVASRMEVHSVIELYSSDSWCGKFSARPWIWTPCVWNSFSILDDMLCETCVVFSKLLFGPWIRQATNLFPMRVQHEMNNIQNKSSEFALRILSILIRVVTLILTLWYFCP